MKEMNRDQFEAIMTRYREGRCSPAEKAAVERAFLEGMQLKDVPADDTARQEVWAKVKKHLRDSQPTKVVVLRQQLLRYTAAAAVFVLAAFSAYYLLTKKTTTIERIIHPDALPGSAVAYLTLGNGQQVQLGRGVQADTLARQSGYTLINAGDVLNYTADNNAADDAAPVMNVLTTPKGGQYRIVLPDGSQVWLNAASRLKFPANFARLKTRKVELSGEGYFEVAKDASRPFIVETPTQQVKVLGTHFNVLAYADEKAVITTLLKGSVTILSQQLNPAPLIPGQQAVHQNNRIRIEPADDNAVAWTLGKIKFKDADLQTVMRQISRWYNIEVRYEGPITSRTFTGGINRNTNLATLLEILRMSGIEFSMEASTTGKVLIVKSKTNI